MTAACSPSPKLSHCTSTKPIPEDEEDGGPPQLGQELYAISGAGHKAKEYLESSWKLLHLARNTQEFTSLCAMGTKNAQQQRKL